MNPRNIKNFFIFTSLLTSASCDDSTSLTELKANESDTIKIMRSLIDSAFYRDKLPDISALTKNNPFGDTVIFRS